MEAVQIKDFVASHGLKYPLILGRRGIGESLELLMEAKDIQGCNKDHSEFLDTLKTRAAGKGIALSVTDGGPPV